ncbi:MAG TPA: response regulator transcription factor [Aggregatilineales bacterium]|nr:response regulator transcription factor [Aggregatilineales bacterium]
MTFSILIVDDDPIITHALAYRLQKTGYIPLVASSAEEGLLLADQNSVDTILLDIGLPGMDGLEALRLFQSKTSAPIIFLTARRRELDEIFGLELGADDYITKPFDMDVLLTRLRVVLRRGTRPKHTESLLQVGDLEIDPVGRTVRLAGDPIVLAPREFDLLHLLAFEVGHVLSVEDLLSRVWGVDWIGESQTIYVHIRWLREKLESDPSQPKRILTVKGVGYKLVPVSE